MICPDEIELAQFVARLLDDDRVRALEDHFDLCRDCRRLVYALATPLAIVPEHVA
ncbi:MAG TPA: hypothetical protein VFQ53_07550 [Kofleriaceae bacterium]|nr:hypothetical protein [Kofleriaceae bacterium]